MDDFGKGFFAATALWFIVGLLISLGVFGNGYRCGQEDALAGKWHHARVVTPDGSVQYIELAKPTTRPVTVEVSR